MPFETIVTAPLTAPEVAGLKTTLKAMLPPAATELPVAMPVTLNPVPVRPTFEKVSAAFPGFWSMIGCEFGLPSETIPKLTLEGVADSCA